MFTAPVDGWYEVRLWGAAGGADTIPGDEYGQGGRGGYSVGQLRFYRGQKRYVYVGEPGHAHMTASGATFNGGGLPGSNGWSGSGGGASDIRLYSGPWNYNLSSRIIVAAGGGGGGARSDGGAGGGLSGMSTGNVLGASQTSPGQNAGFGVGGNCINDGGGGGGGWYGGGATGEDFGGGGGSSYIGGHPNAVIRNMNTIPGNAWMPMPYMLSEGNMLGNSGPCFVYFRLIEEL